ncbi:MAG: ribose-phosphate pyrophosphokinase [Gammaproteobacteria bacterium]|jgi:ribose-phosphate pyrophosphokinase
MKFFALDATKEFAERIAGRLSESLGMLEEPDRADGERKVRPTDSLCGPVVYAIHSLYSEPRQSIDDKLVRPLSLIGTLHECGSLTELLLRTGAAT